MTYSEDVPRTRATEETQEFLLQRIEAMDKEIHKLNQRIVFLEAVLEVNQNLKFNN
tara:strand:- start:576 stop:743 length:168 start_codon:yes stop_codon:yes gene_type:complete